MPRSETVLKIFLASPSDLQPEREITADVIASLNAAWTKTQSLRLELARWEDVAPGVGTEPQDVISRQVGDDYDIFLGLFWKTIGTPTKKDSSGSIEEFRGAHKRYSQQRTTPKIMIYFKMSAPASMEDIDPGQLVAVRQFRREINQLGVFYRDFETPKQFEEMLRLHLSQVVDEIRNSPAEPRIEVSQATVPNEIVDLDETHDEGFLDMVIRGTEDFEKVSEATKHMTARIGHFSERMVQATHAINELGPLTKPNAVREAKRIVDGSADDLDTFASEIEAYTPIFSAAYSRAVDSYSGAAVLLRDFKVGDKKQLVEARQAMTGLKENLRGVMGMVKGFREAVEAWPRASTRLNRAKRRAKIALSGLYSAAIIAGDLTKEAEAMIVRLLEQEGELPALPEDKPI